MNEQDYLMHYGVKGMKWGVRRYQNPDGTRTSLGRQHEAELKGRSGSSFGDRARSTAGRVKSALTSDKAKKAAKIAGVALGVAAAAGAAYMYSKNKGAVDSFVKNAAGRAISSTKSAASKGKKYLSKAVQSAGMNSAAAADIARNKLKAAGAAIKDSQVARSAYGAATKAGSAIKGTASKVANSRVGQAAQMVGSSAAKAGRTYANNAGRAVKSAASKAANSRAGQAAQMVGSSAVKAGRTYANNAGRAVKNAASNVRETAKAAKFDYDMNFRGTGKQAVKKASSAVKGAASRAGTATRSAVNSARNAINSRKTSGEQWLTRGAKSSPTTNKTAMDAYDSLYRKQKASKARNTSKLGRTSGEQWLVRGAKSSPTTNQTAMDAYASYYKKKKK